MSHFLNKISYDEWLARGKKSMLYKARERMRQILENHKSLPMPPEGDKEIDSLLEKARRC